MADTKKDNKILSISGVDQIPGTRKEVGKVTPEERDEIRTLFERRNGLIELAKTLATTPGLDLEGNPLYEKLTLDMGTTSTKFQEWWENSSRQYGWDSLPGYQWEIDFDTCSIFIKKQ